MRKPYDPAAFDFDVYEAGWKPGVDWGGYPISEIWHKIGPGGYGRGVAYPESGRIELQTWNGMPVNNMPARNRAAMLRSLQELQ